MITIQGLKKRFRHTDALRGVDLKVPAGRVTAFLGPNGAGKTTTIKCVLNLIKRDAGDLEVLGTDATKLKPEHWCRIGYVSENPQLPDWLTVPQLLDYVRPMYGKFWDRDFEKKLLADFELPLTTKLKSLSRGQRMKAALLSSLAYRPKLVVLDEPFSGLDPLVRDEFLRGLLELTGKEGWTVFISSHDIEEVEHLADRVAIIDKGRIQLDESADSLRQRFREVEVLLEQETTPVGNLPGTWINIEQAGRSIRYVDVSFEEDRQLALVRDHFPGALRHEARPLSLREIFVALARTYRLANGASTAASSSDR